MPSWVARPRTSAARRYVWVLWLLVSALVLFALTGGTHLAPGPPSGHRIAAWSTHAALGQVDLPANHHQASPRSALKDSPVLPARGTALRTAPVMEPPFTTSRPGPQVAAGPPYFARGP